MTDADHLASIIRSTPILVIDRTRALKAGDRAALEYASAIATWHREASAALAALSQGQAGRIIDHDEAGGGKSQEVGRARPNVGLPSELVSVREFSPGLAI